MTGPAYILARSDGENISLILGIIIVLISVISSLAQKMLKKRQEQQAEQEPTRVPRRPAAEEGPPPRRPAPAEETHRKMLLNILGIAEEDVLPAARPAATIAPPPIPAAARPAPRQMRPRPSAVREARRPLKPGELASGATAARQVRQGSLKRRRPPILTPANRRDALVHYEILAPAKALRPGPEMWDI